MYFELCCPHMAEGFTLYFTIHYPHMTKYAFKLPWHQVTNYYIIIYILYYLGFRFYITGNPSGGQYQCVQQWWMFWSLGIKYQWWSCVYWWPRWRQDIMQCKNLINNQGLSFCKFKVRDFSQQSLVVPYNAINIVVNKIVVVSWCICVCWWIYFEKYLVGWI